MHACIVAHRGVAARMDDIVADARRRHCGGRACMDGIVAARINACTAHELQDAGIVKSALRVHALQAKHRRMHNRLNRSGK